MWWDRMWQTLVWWNGIGCDEGTLGVTESFMIKEIRCYKMILGVMRLTWLDLGICDEMVVTEAVHIVRYVIHHKTHVTMRWNNFEIERVFETDMLWIGCYFQRSLTGGEIKNSTDDWQFRYPWLMFAMQMKRLVLKSIQN